MPNSDKSHDTALRLMEILKILLNEDIAKYDLIEKLKFNNDINKAYTIEAYIKYFNTFEELGIPVKKEDNVYGIQKALINIDLTPAEEKLLIKIIHSIPKLNNKIQEETIKKLFFKIDKYLNLDLKKELKAIENIEYTDTIRRNIINTLKQIMTEQTEVSITFSKNSKTEETYNDLTIKKIIEKNDHYYVLCFNPSMQRSRRICVDCISEIKPSPKQSHNIESNVTVVYEVYGRLSKSYKIKPWESLIDFGNDFIRISNTKEDYETLLPRLLKYGENCKILRPNNVVDDFLSLTNEVLQNLEDKECLK